MSDDDAPPVQLVDELELSLARDEAFRALLCLCFPHSADIFTHSRAYHGSAPLFSAWMEENGLPIAHVAVTYRRIRVGAPDSRVFLRVAGVQNVAVRPEWRGRRLARRVLAAACEEARRRAVFDVGLLFCASERIKMYTHAGWRDLGSRTVTRVDEKGEEIAMATAAMWVPLLVDAFPPGPIHLQGNDW